MSALTLNADHALAAAAESVVASPDGSIEFHATFKGRMGFEVSLKNRPVIEPSRMIFAVDGADLTSNAVAGEIKTYHLNDTYPWRGAHSVAVNHCNGETIALKSGNTSYTLEVRVFNDGVAYRFIAPGEAGQCRVPDEASTFCIPDGSRVWYHDLKGHYEGQHTNNLVADIPNGQWVAPPMTFKLPKGAGYASITEADLVNYSGMALQATGARQFTVMLAHKQPPSHPFVLRYTKEDVARLSQPATVSGTITTPWRVVMMGTNLNTLVNCDILPDLCPPPDPKFFPQGLKTDWIKPGRAVWKYLDGGDSSIEGTKEFCREAQQLGFEYDVVEGYWSRWSDAEIADLAAYAKQHGVRLLFWKHSKSLRTPEAREDFFKKLHDLGVAGAKIDFFDNEHKEIIDLYQALDQTAAKYHLVVNFHGSDKPTGTMRTWPNEITREAVRGMESMRLRDRATHETTLPFTRMLAGPADYSVVHFGDRKQNTTWPHQIATAAIFSQPMLTYAANPSNLLANAGVDLIKSIPPDWDETIVLPPSEIGKLAVYARRSGDTWFLAVIGGPEAQTIQVPLSFLGPGAYAAMLIRDSGAGPNAEQIEHTSQRREDTLTINLRSGGGFIGRFTRK
ncbi:MAG TPA: glycoside hydrolase family 97 catalytic domain-containing protein [Candidatus Angelobacter sp.]|nr:glycoside hydrolase family 97 catalytic domain-containing protein [Candidatus Angelobacter sp.]